jgi:hypothetical protein
LLEHVLFSVGSNLGGSEDAIGLTFTNSGIAVYDVVGTGGHAALCEQKWVCPPGFTCMPGSPSKVGSARCEP